MLTLSRSLSIRYSECWLVIVTVVPLRFMCYSSKAKCVIFHFTTNELPHILYCSMYVCTRVSLYAVILLRTNIVTPQLVHMSCLSLYWNTDARLLLDGTLPSNWAVSDCTLIVL